MSRTQRHRAIRSEIARIGRVPSIRVMARAIACALSTVAEDYRALGLRSCVPCGRPSVEAVPTVPVMLRIPASAYDHYCHMAAAASVPVRAAIRSAVIAGARSRSAQFLI